MKKIIRFTPILLFLFLISSCLKKDDDSVDPWENIDESDLQQLPGFGIPTVFISTPGKTFDYDLTPELYGRDEYVKDIKVQINGGADFDNYQGTGKIRGRGHSSWHFPKKPYKLKLYDAASLLGLRKGKEYDLLSNWRDGFLMANPVAFKMSELLDMPYTIHLVPITLVFNGDTLGSYLMTEHKETGSHRIQVGPNGALLELDIYEDDEFKFVSKYYHLAVMPKVDDQAHLEKIETGFNKMESLIHASNFPNNDYKKYLNIKAAAKFILINIFTGNEEIKGPKSVHMITKDAKYFSFSPVWDYDWAYGYEKPHDTYFNDPDKPIFKKDGTAAGTIFFHRLMSDPEIQDLIKQYWTDFKAEGGGFSKLLRYIDDYAANMKDAQKADYKKWGRGSGDFEADVASLKNWLQERGHYIDDLVSNW